MKNTGASFNRHGSKQDYRTPRDFMEAVAKRYGIISVDLAASKSNAQASVWIDKKRDSFTVHWHKLDGLLWLNPPFNDIAPWARKCAIESVKGAKILFLTPASIGSVWFNDYVHSKAMVWALNPRLCFDGKNPYPKDCILSVFGFNTGFDVWVWK